MKKFIIAFAAVAMFISASAFSGTKNGDNPALATFQNTFKGALDVKWGEENDIITASFVLNNTRAVAYFSSTGELLGTARNILFNQLPLLVVAEINKRYATASVYDITEYTLGSETFYIMQVTLPTKTLKLRVSSAGDINVEKKTKR